MNQGPRGAQDLVHAMEMGAGRRWVQRWLVITAGVAFKMILWQRQQPKRTVSRKKPLCTQRSTYNQRDPTLPRP